MAALFIADGSEQWAKELSPVFEDGQGPRGPRFTPVVDNGQVFAQYSRGTLHCLDAKSGKIQWEIDYAKLAMKFVGEKGRVPEARRHGFTNAPLVVGGMVYATAGAKAHGVVCFNRKNGKVIWNALDYEPGYAPPVPTVLAGRQQFICFLSMASSGWTCAMGLSFGRFQ